MALFRGIPENSCNMILARAIFSCIPFIKDHSNLFCHLERKNTKRVDIEHTFEC